MSAAEGIEPNVIRFRAQLIAAELSASAKATNIERVTIQFTNQIPNFLNVI